MNKVFGCLLVIMLIAGVMLSACAPPPAPPPAPPAPPPAPPAPPPAPAPAPPPAPLTPAEFYAQNMVDLICPSSAGGSTDFLSRLLSSFWPQYVEGGAMRVKNMPGAGTIIGTNYVWNAKPDGLTMELALGHASLLAPTVGKAKGMEYDITKFIYIVDMARSPLMFEVSIKAPYESIDELKGVTGFRFAASEVQQMYGAVILSQALGMKDAKIVAGYDGSTDVGLAMARGEVDGTTFSASTARKWIDKGGVMKEEPFAVMGFDRSDWFPDVPALSEVVTLTPEQENWLRIVAAFESTRVITLPPGVPQDRVDFVRDIFVNKILQDKAFVKQAKRVWKIWSEYRSAEEYMEVVRKTAAIPEAQVEGLERVVERMLP